MEKRAKRGEGRKDKMARYEGVYLVAKVDRDKLAQRAVVKYLLCA